MKRFDDKLLIEVLEAMRTPGGRAISEEAWQAIEKTDIEKEGNDTKLRGARGWCNRDLRRANDAPGTDS